MATRRSAVYTLAIAAAISVIGALLMGVQPVGTASEPIGELIRRAQPGDTVVVPPGTYREQIVIDKPLTLIGEGAPVIDGGRKGDVVVIAAENVTLRGFVVQASARDVSGEPAGIRVRGNGATIADNRVRDVLYGIVLEGSNDNRIVNNHVSSIEEFSAERRGHGLYLWYTNGNLLEGNTVENVKDGIFLGFATHTRAIGNHLSGMRYGMHYMYADHNEFERNVFRDSVAGASIMFSRDIRLRGNEFAYNQSAASGYGLLFKDVDDVEMVDNRIHHNRLGITMEGTPNRPDGFVTLRNNFIGFNQIAVELASTTRATFTQNSFVGNIEQVKASGGSLSHNTWALDGQGNYWDEYQGYDANSDGVGDIPYRYEDVFGELVRRNEAVRAYSYTPARAALDLAASWFPAFRPDPNVVDPSPLMSPLATLDADTTSRGRITGLAVALVLTGIPLLVMFAPSRRRGAKW